MKFRMVGTVAVFALVVVSSFTVTADGMLANEARQKRLAWFREAGYGIFVHYLAGNMMGPSTLNSDGVFREWNTCVDAFDVDNFAKIDAYVESLLLAEVGYRRKRR